MENFRVTIASPPDREQLVAELFFGEEQWAELNQDELGTLSLEIYPRRDGKPWVLKFADALAALNYAKRRLCGQ